MIYFSRSINGIGNDNECSSNQVSRVPSEGRMFITIGKKSSSRLSGGCAITTISTTGQTYAKLSDFYAKLNVLNLNVTNLYQFQLKLI